MPWQNKLSCLQIGTQYSPGIVRAGRDEYVCQWFQDNNGSGPLIRFVAHQKEMKDLFYSLGILDPMQFD